MAFDEPDGVRRIIRMVKNRSYSFRSLHFIQDMTFRTYRAIQFAVVTHFWPPLKFYILAYLRITDVFYMRGRHAP